MKPMVITEPTRETWKLFCSEPKLTPEELALWNEIRRAIRSGDHYDDELAEFFFVNVPRLVEGPKTKKDWSDMVENADRFRRFVRQHFPLYEQWKRTRQHDRINASGSRRLFA